MKLSRWILLFIIIMSAGLQAQTADILATAEADSTLQGAPVIYNGKVMFYLYSNLGIFTPFERSVIIGKRLEELGQQKSLYPDSLRIIKFPDRYDIHYLEHPIMSVCAADSLVLGQPMQDIALAYHQAIIEQFIPFFISFSLKQSIFGILKTVLLVLLILAVSIFLYRVLGKLGNWLKRLAERIQERYPLGLVLKGIRFLGAEQLDRSLKIILGVIRFGLGLLLLYFTVYFLLYAIPLTQPIALQLNAYIARPIVDMWRALLNYLPSLFFIIIVIAVSRYLLRFLKYLFDEIGKGNIRFTGFYQDWAFPTYQIVRFLILFFVVVIIFPYLPGSGSPAFQGISIFVGVLFSFGSSSAISNIIAGIILTYMRAFKVGNFIQVGDKQGVLIESSLLTIRLRTVKNEEVSIPNSIALSGNIMDYSSYANSGDLILHTNISMGYDVPRQTVQDILIKAALQSEGINIHKEPFVNIVALRDYYVEYELNAFSEAPEAMGRIYTELHKNVLDLFHAAGIEMVLPMYNAVRDGAGSTVPKAEIVQQEADQDSANASQ